MKLRRRDTGEEWTLGEGQLIGRLSECDLRLEDPSVSRRHARVERDPAGVSEWRLVDLGSSNGCFHNGRRGASFPLRPGDLVTFGSVPCDVVGDEGDSNPSSLAAEAATSETELSAVHRERSRIRSELRRGSRSRGLGDLDQQPLGVKLLALGIALAVLVGVTLLVRWLSGLA